MKHIFNILVLGALMAYLVPAQAQNYEAQQPSATFQSTSTFTGSGSTYSSNPTINENGTASTPSYAPSQAPKGGIKTSLPGTPSTEGDGGNVPVGDAVLPLLLMAMVYGGWCMVYRRKRRV